MAKRREYWLYVIPMLTLTACDRGDGAQLGFFNQESPAYLRVDDSKAMCDTCIQASLRILGDTAGPGSIFTPFWSVIKDKVGNYWVSQPGTVKVFSDDGRFVRAVGRLGQGPFEFGNQPEPFYADPLGRVHIYDPENLRVTVVNRDYSLAKEFHLTQTVFDLAGLPDTSRYVVNAWVPSADQIGLPLHVLQDDSIVASFGLTQEDAAVETPLVTRRTIAVDDHQRIIAAKIYEYVIDIWSPTGRYLGRVEGSKLNDDPRGHGQLRSQIVAVKLDADDHLWVVTMRPRPDWREFTQVDQSGRITMKPGAKVSAIDLYTRRVDVIDLNAGLVIARLEHAKGGLHSFIGRHEIMGTEPTPDGDLRLGIWTLGLTSAQSR